MNGLKQNGRIVCDDNLRDVFKTPVVNSADVLRLLQPHITTIPGSSSTAVATPLQTSAPQLHTQTEIDVI